MTNHTYYLHCKDGIFTAFDHSPRGVFTTLWDSEHTFEVFKDRLALAHSHGLRHSDALLDTRGRA